MGSTDCTAQSAVGKYGRSGSQNGCSCYYSALAGLDRPIGQICKSNRKKQLQQNKDRRVPYATMTSQLWANSRTKNTYTYKAVANRFAEHCSLYLRGSLVCDLNFVRGGRGYLRNARNHENGSISTPMARQKLSMSEIPIAGRDEAIGKGPGP